MHRWAKNDDAEGAWRMGLNIPSGLTLSKNSLFLSFLTWLKNVSLPLHLSKMDAIFIVHLYGHYISKFICKSVLNAWRQRSESYISGLLVNWPQKDMKTSEGIGIHLFWYAGYLRICDSRGLRTVQGCHKHAAETYLCFPRGKYNHNIWCTILDNL